MRQNQSQARRISSQLEDRLAHHRSSATHLRRQSHSIDSSRLLPPTPLRIRQVNLYQTIALRRPAPICNSNGYSHQAPSITDHKALHLLNPRDRKAHLIKALRLSHHYHSLPLAQRNPYQYRQIHHPNPGQPGYPATHSRPFAPQPRHPNTHHAQCRPTRHSRQQKLGQPHSPPHSR